MLTVCLATEGGLDPTQTNPRLHTPHQHPTAAAAAAAATLVFLEVGMALLRKVILPEDPRTLFPGRHGRGLACRPQPSLPPSTTPI